MIMNRIRLGVKSPYLSQSYIYKNLESIYNTKKVYYSLPNNKSEFKKIVKMEVFPQNSEYITKFFDEYKKSVYKSTKNIEIGENFVELLNKIDKEGKLSYSMLETIENDILNNDLTFFLDLRGLNEILQHFTHKNFGSSGLYHKFADSLLKTEFNIESQEEICYFVQIIENFTKANALTDELEKYFDIKISSIITRKLSYLKNEEVIDYLSIFCFYNSLCGLKNKKMTNEICSTLKEFTIDNKCFISEFSQKKVLKYIWNFFQSMKLIEPVMYESFKKDGTIFKFSFNFNGPIESEDQKEITSLIEKICKKDVEKEKSIGIYVVDIFIKPKIIIEINGFQHYFGKGNRRSGIYQIKVNNLKLLGFSLVEINLGEIRNLTIKEKSEYLSKFI